MLREGLMFIFEGPNVESIRKKYGFTEANYFTAGSSAELYCNGQTVFRLSSDCSSHCLTVIGNQKGWAVPKLFADYGAHIETDESPEWNHYWLGEFEKMIDLSTNPELEKSLTEWLSQTFKEAGIDDSLIYGEDFPALREALNQRVEEGRFAELANTLIAMTKECDGEMDIGVGNFMFRASTGEVVVVDPAHGMEPFPESWEARGVISESRAVISGL